MLKEHEKLSLIIPAYNEEEAIEETVIKTNNELRRLNIGYEIIVVNDGSKDRTAEILKKFDFIKVVNNPYNLGYGASLKRGIKSASGDWIMIIDSDGTYPIEETDRLLKDVGDYDMVVGKRRTDVDHFGRRPAKWILKKIASFVSGHQIPDLNSGMRIFRKKIALEFFHLFPKGFSFTSTITLACFARDYTVKYTDINYFKRKGKSGIRPKHFFDFIALIFKLFFYFKPLKALTPACLIIFLLGLAKLIRDYILEGHIGILAALLIIFSIQLFFMALVSEVIIKSGPSR